MDADPNNRTLTITSTTDENVCFSDVTTVVKRWMIDFSFVSLCQFFKEGKFEEFNQTISTLETIIDGTPHLNTEQRQKRQICGFLARIMHGKHLDVSFDRDERLSPLMSAVGVWASQEETVADVTLFQHITNLLYVQSVAVCLEKGNCVLASSALKWLEEECEIPQAATKVVKAGQETGEDSETREASYTTSQSSEHSKVNQETGVLMRPKKKLLSTRNIHPWKPESGKKPALTVMRKGVSTRLTFRRASSETTLNTTTLSNTTLNTNTTRKTHGRWPWDLDLALKAGVKRHGEGKWSRILQEHDFQGRTGVQLKDRWRVLKKAHKVNSS
uniref:Telomeric repeat-binding factor n=1 Tax=Oncorhynchus tshawytscha TaxID=74940 RepID=A0AAZ3P409_ONCTS